MPSTVGYVRAPERYRSGLRWSFDRLLSPPVAVEWTSCKPRDRWWKLKDCDASSETKRTMLFVESREGYVEGGTTLEEELASDPSDCRVSALLWSCVG
ncbi:Protein of unknown function [Gryllus bimaculatus]|nr:Protein of unknown function [Gryllus bimaculatus]